VSDLRVGSAIRAVRRRRRWTQERLADAAQVSSSTVSRIEHGRLDGTELGRLRRVAGALDIRLDVVARWQGADLDRLINARHSAMHEAVAQSFAARHGWSILPEVSFSIYGERGVVDILAWHPETRSLIVIELKTAISDVNELLGTVDRKRRLAVRIVAERGWVPAHGLRLGHRRRRSDQPPPRQRASDDDPERAPRRRTLGGGLARPAARRPAGAVVPANWSPNDVAGRLQRRSRRSLSVGGLPFSRRQWAPARSTRVEPSRSLVPGASGRKPQGRAARGAAPLAYPPPARFSTSSATISRWIWFVPS
jgi:transcriptional regulator with XRE-family HTH domain